MMKTSVDILSLLTFWDWLVFTLIALLTVAFVVFGQLTKKKTNSEEQNFIDLMLMGRQLTLPMFIATIVATWYGGIFGVAQIAFDFGIFNFVTQGIFWYVSYVIFAFFITHKIKKYKALTLPDLVGQMFGPIAEKISALFNFINLIPIAYAISIGLLIQMLWGYELYISVTIGVTFVLGYSLMGGFRAVVFSDLIQFFVMCIAVGSVLVFSIGTYGISPLANLPDRYFDPTGGHTLLQTLSWGLIAISTLVDPNFYQRTFAAKSFETAKIGILVATGIWILFDLSLTFGAMYAKAMIPEANSKHAYLIYAIQLLPTGMRGFMLAGVVATILSTLDSYIFLAGSTLAYDLVPKKLKGKVYIHHLGVLAVGIIAIVFSLFFSGDIKNIWKTFGSLSSSALLVPILWGHMSKRKLNDTHFVASSLCGAVSSILWRFFGLTEIYQLDEIYVGISSSLIALIGVHCLVKQKLPH